MRTSPVPDPPPLSDGVVTLRRRRTTDVRAQAEAAHDPETSRWLDDTPPDPDADPAISLRRTADSFAAGRSATLTVADATTDEPLGLVNVQFRSDALATLAYSVFPAARGRGIAGRAVALARSWGFGGLGLEELRLEIDPANTSSRRVAEKAGWTLLADELTDRGEQVFSSRRAERS
jgi:RimJ/RimL family protein N-acetyltransferase